MKTEALKISKEKKNQMLKGQQWWQEQSQWFKDIVLFQKMKSNYIQWMS